VVFDLTVAVEVGLMLACVFFIWRMSTLFRMTPTARRDLPPGVQVVELYGALFFGAVGKVEDLVAQLPAGTRSVVLDMHQLIAMDTSGIDALQQLHRTLDRQGMAMVCADVNQQPLSLMRRSGFEALVGAQHIAPSVDEALVRLR